MLKGLFGFMIAQILMISCLHKLEIVNIFHQTHSVKFFLENLTYDVLNMTLLRKDTSKVIDEVCVAQ